MARWVLIYPLLILVLIGLGVYIHIHAANLSLPFPQVLTFLDLLLPLAAAINAFYFPHLLRRFYGTNNIIKELTPAALQLLQLILTVVLLTIFTALSAPDSLRSCLLERRWAALFSAHDADAIRRIQDAFNCCGFNSVHDRAWPFRHGSPDTPQVTCEGQYHRSLACRAPWEQAMVRNGGWEAGISLAVALMQLASLVVYRMVRNRRTGSGGGWPQLGMFRRVESDNTRQPLLGDGRAGEERYQDEEASGQHGTGEENGRKPAGTDENQSAPYRVEPAGLIHEDPWSGADRSE